MAINEWLIFFLIVQVIHFAGTWKLYQRANRKAWEAAIPVYNAFILMRIIKRPKWWVFLLFVPIINLLMFPIVWIETARSFGFNKRKDTILVLLTLGFYLYYINYATNSIHKINRSLNPRTSIMSYRLIIKTFKLKSSSKNESFLKKLLNTFTHVKSSSRQGEF